MEARKDNKSNYWLIFTHVEQTRKQKSVTIHSASHGLFFRLIMKADWQNLLSPGEIPASTTQSKNNIYLFFNGIVELVLAAGLHLTRKNDQCDAAGMMTDKQNDEHQHSTATVTKAAR